METILIISSVLLWIVSLFTLFLTFALVRRINRDAGGGVRQAPLPGLAKGEQAPAFRAQTLDGETVTLADYAGRKVAFLFVSTHCRPCRELLPQIKPLAPGIAEAGVDLVLVSNSPAEQTRTLMEEFTVAFPVLIVPESGSSFFSEYKVRGTPSYCLLDEQGIVLSSGHPSMEWGEWKDLTASWTQRAAVASSKKRR